MGMLDTRLLRTFARIAAEGTITGAATAMQLSQPAVSKQLAQLEQQLGVRLAVRSNSRLELTPEGHLLLERAQEILRLLDQAEHEVHGEKPVLAQEIRIGAAESQTFRVVARAMAKTQQSHPGITFRVHAADGPQLERGFRDGSFSFGLFVEPWDLSGYDTLRLPRPDRWGLITRKDSPLAAKEAVRPEDLVDLPLIVPEGIVDESNLSTWLRTGGARLNRRVTYNLLFNAALMVDEGVGHALGLENLVNSPGLTFIPAEPALESHLYLAWRRGRTLSRAEQAFLDCF